MNWTYEDFQIFIDRDGYPFGLILTYLRADGLPPNLDKYSLWSLIQEAKYYQLNDLLKIATERISNYDEKKMCYTNE